MGEEIIKERLKQLDEIKEEIIKNITKDFKHNTKKGIKNE